MERKDIEKLAREENKTFLKINRVPTHIKDLFIQLAEGEFTGDYGLLLKWLLEQTLEYQRVKDVLLDKEFMTYILENKSGNEQENVPEEDSGKKTFGDILKKRREEKEKEVKDNE